MKMLIVGATGKTGVPLVELALAQGHHVTALVRHPEEMPPQPNLTVVAGDVTDSDSVFRAVLGQEAVICTVGAGNPVQASTLCTEAAQNIVAAMQQHGVRRYVGISMLGAGDSAAHSDFLYHHILLPTFLHGALKDKEGMEREAMESGLDWTLVRPPILTDDPATQDYAVLEANDSGTVHRISRADLAAFLLSCVTDAHYIREAVIVGR